MKVSKLLLIILSIILILPSARLAYASNSPFVPASKNLITGKYYAEAESHYKHLNRIFFGFISYPNLISNNFEIINLPNKVYLARLIDASFSSDYLLKNLNIKYEKQIYLAHLIDADIASAYLFRNNFPQSLTTPKKKIKRKLVPDQYINDRNSFMTNFGLSSSTSLFTADFTNPLATKASIEGTDAALAIYDDNYTRARMTNNINYDNIWQKDTKYIESIISGGALGYLPLSVASSSVEKLFHMAGFMRLHFRFPTLKRFSPEISVAESFLFKFDRLQGFKENEGTNAYNDYFIKLPLGFYIPFAGWKSLAYLDARYSSSYYNINIIDSIIVNNRAKSSGKVYGTESEFTFRFYFDTPIVRSPSINEYSYAGFYYSEHISPRTYSGGGGLPILLISNARSGGIFYDMKKDIFKGIMINANVALGYSHIEPGNKGNIASGGEYTNVKGLIYYRIGLSLGYEYIFKSKGVGIGFDIGVTYLGYTAFFFPTENNKYAPTLQGDLKYFFQVNFLLGY